MPSVLVDTSFHKERLSHTFFLEKPTILTAETIRVSLFASLFLAAIATVAAASHKTGHVQRKMA